MKHVVVGTAGHIDHGKSALVRALTGIDPDRLKEEKERGITIDLGFAFVKTEDDLALGFVDVPGHERFVKNMLAGVGGIDLVVLVVAADESVMPQTREHFDICRLLRIPRGLVAVTKSDLVDEELREITALEAKELVAGSFLEDAPIVPVSSKTGAGLDELRAAIWAIATEVPGRPAAGPARLPIDRVFSMKGFGTVVTGTLASGVLSQDDEVEILPQGRRARIRGLQVHGEKRDSAAAGQRTAVNLQGVEVSDIHRGSALVGRDSFTPTMMLDAEVEVLRSSPVPVKDLTRLHLHLGTAQVLARARVLGNRGLIAPGSSGAVQLRLEAPVVAARGDRFILRRYSPLETIAGGRVLDAYPPKHSVRKSEVLDRFRSFSGSDASEAAGRIVEESGVAGISEHELARRLFVEPSALGSLVDRLASNSHTFVVSGSPRILVSASVVASLEERIDDELARFQKKNPLLEGMPKSELREKVAAGFDPDVFEWVLAKAVSEGRLGTARDLVATAGHTIQMSPEEAKAMDVLVKEYRASGYRPKSLADTASDSKLDVKLLERVQRVLLKDGRLVQIAEGMIFHHDVLHGLKEEVRTYKATRGRIDVGAFKELFGVTRKHAIPLLEWLDRERVTKRTGNERVIL
ncbi:MAG TPA: selenocysteine-specific translation elongation factor [Vicinamibacteria bacterium]|nr:selenocysteine-specific translation elongation factor [Vicinamibacteria bacterium]